MHALPAYKGNRRITPLISLSPTWPSVGCSKHMLNGWRGVRILNTNKMRNESVTYQWGCSCNHCCIRKAELHIVCVCVCVCIYIYICVCVYIYIYVCVCVCVYSLSIQHVKRMRRVTLSFVASTTLQHFATLSHNRHDFREKGTEHKKCVHFLYNFCPKHLSF
jgi:hypothetical protein